MAVPAVIPMMYGWRNVLLIESFLAFSLALIWFVKPPGGYSPELLYAVGYVIVVAGGIVVAGITARAANKIAEKWEPAQPIAPSSVATRSTTRSASTTVESEEKKP